MKLLYLMFILMPVSILSYKTTLLENKTFDYNHRIKYIQYSDGDIFDIFYTCSEPDEPLLMLETREVWMNEEKVEPIASAYYYDYGQIPLENPQDRNLCSVSFIDDFSSPFIFTLYPSNCTGKFNEVFEFENGTLVKDGSKMNLTCTLLEGFEFPVYDSYELEFAPAWTYVYIYDDEYFMFLVRPPFLKLKKKKTNHLLELDFDDQDHATVHAAYYGIQLCYKIERKENDVWKTIYEGEKKHTYAVHDWKRGQTVKYRAFIRNCKDLEEYGRKIWSNASEVLTVHVNFTTNANDTSSNGVDEFKKKELDFKRAVIILTSLVSVILLAALSYFVCHRKLGACNACRESVPVPKIFVPMDLSNNGGSYNETAPCNEQTKCIKLENETKGKESNAGDLKVWRDNREDHEEIKPCLFEDGNSGYIVNQDCEVLLKDKYIKDITNMQEIKSIMKDHKDNSF